jgi:uncharacterized protein YcfJ
MNTNRQWSTHAFGWLLLLTSMEAHAQSLFQVPVKSVEMATVQHVIHQRVCGSAVSIAQTPKSAPETVAGAIIGGAVGSALAHGPGQAAATVLGAVAGAALVQQAQPTRVTPTPLEQCVVQSATQTVPIFKVRFDWDSKDYEVMLAQQPGQTITVQVQGTHADGNLVVAVLPPPPIATIAPQYTAPPVITTVQTPAISYATAYAYDYLAPAVTFAPVYGYPYTYNYYPRAYVGGWYGHRGYGRRWR